jgi:hypothetical protein
VGSYLRTTKSSLLSIILLGFGHRPRHNHHGRRARCVTDYHFGRYVEKRGGASGLPFSLVYRALRTPTILPGISIFE